MGIFKKANNIYITVRDTYTSISGSSYEEAEEVIIEATNGDLELVSQKKVIMQGLGNNSDTQETEEQSSSVSGGNHQTQLKKFLVHFRRPKDYRGEYGFDWLREEYIYPLVTVTNDNDGSPINRKVTLCKGVDSLKEKYREDVVNPINPYGKEYFPAWLSIFPFTTNEQFPHGSRMHKNGVFLDLQIDEIDTIVPDGTEIIFETGSPYLEITPNKIPISEVLSTKKRSRRVGGNLINFYYLPKKINIKCKDQPLKRHKDIKVFAKLKGESKEIGKLMVYKNDVIPKAELVVVNVITNNNNKAKLYEGYQFLLKRQAFNQALIRAEVKIDTEFNLNNLRHNSDVNVFLNNYRSLRADQILDWITKLYEKYGKYGKVPGGINSNNTRKTFLFFTSLTAGNTLGITHLEHNLWGNVFTIFHSGLLDEHTIVHECAHSLSLPHIFDDDLSQFPFYWGYTDNYMDYTWQRGENDSRGGFFSTGDNTYKGKMYSFFKWQWDIMRRDRSLTFNY
ncbi:hypothetical protein [Capnocytophaga granulosa]|mgnify:CR=1 FL=1|jgi:hypothetical protein|uniref:hypothetical protein n=1 Tax=Capnocytophaga granulosa TaxID=45242 RepID=UPI0028E6EB83|nr:hypothetical protein [Capnocytophaga granulosa]